MTRPDPAPLPRRTHRQRVSLGCFFASVLLALPCDASEALKSFSTLKLKDGRQLTRVEILSSSFGGVSVRHAGGTATLPVDTLPDAVIAALRLQDREASASPASESNALADKPAVAASAPATLADQVAVADAGAIDFANRPAIASDTPAVHEVAAAAAPFLADLPAGPAAPDKGPPPAGEGNLPEFFATQGPGLIASEAPRDLPGRAVITLPSGQIHLLGDVEIRAYPADLFPGYLAEARAKAAAAAQLISENAAAARRSGRTAEADLLAARAHRVAGRHVDYLPITPISTRSDEHGFFTLPAKARQMKLAAAGRLTTEHGQWDYEWIGVDPQAEATLSETNATSVIAAETSPAKYAAQ